MFVWSEQSAAFWEDSAQYTDSYTLLAERAAAHLVPGGAVFEGGCGLGHLSLALAKRGHAVTGMDLSPLPLRYLRENAARANVTLDIRQGDAFALPEAEVWDDGAFCFFGGVREVLSWARVHCRHGLILFKKDWDTHRFTRDAGAIRKFTYPLTLRELDELKVPYETEVFDVDMGQPFRSLGDAVRFFRLYDPGEAPSEAAIRRRIAETGDPVFPFFFSAVRPVGLIALRAEDIRETYTAKEEPK